MRNWITKKQFLAIIILFLALGVFAGGGKVHRVGADINSAYEKLKILADVFGIVEKNYVETVKVTRPDQRGDQWDVGNSGSA